MSNLMKIFLVRAELFKTDRQTGGERERDKQTIKAFLRDIAKTPTELQYNRNLGKTHRLKEM